MEQTIILKIDLKDINKLCRICETKENLIDLSREEYSHLYQKLHKIADLEVIMNNINFNCFVRFLFERNICLKFQIPPVANTKYFQLLSLLISKSGTLDTVKKCQKKLIRTKLS